MIVRTWRRRTRLEDRGRYFSYLQETGVKESRATPGNRGVLVTWRKTEGQAEFFFISLWESIAAVERFAGAKPEMAVFYPEDEEFLVHKDLHVDHYEVLEASGVFREGNGG